MYCIHGASCVNFGGKSLQLGHFGSLWVPIGTLLVPFGSLLVPFCPFFFPGMSTYGALGVFWGAIWVPFCAFWSLLVALEGLSGEL